MGKKTIIIVVLAVLLALGIGGGAWYWQKMQAEELRLTIKVENQYQRNFHQLVAGLDHINAQLAQLLVTTSHQQTLLGLSNLWREVYGAVNDLSQLPVAMGELESTEALLNDTAEYSYYLIRKNVLAQDFLSETDWAQLQEFYQRSKVVKQELSQIEAQILNENLRFADVERYWEAGEQDQAENRIVSAFRGIESQMRAFPELKFEEGVRKIEPEPRAIAGEQISEVQAVAVAEEFFGHLDESPRSGKVEFVSEGGKIPVYGVRLYASKEGDEPVYIEVSQQGGMVLQMYRYSEPGQPRYNATEAVELAQTFLKKWDFPDMVLVEKRSDEQMADLTFVPVQQGIYLYSDMVKIQLALDTGAIMNYDQTSYATHHYQRPLPPATITEAEVRRGMNPNFVVDDIRLALIPDEYSSRERLTYEVRGKVVEETFAIFVDATTAEELRIVRLTAPAEYLINVGKDAS